jgi:hypothetical protein
VPVTKPCDTSGKPVTRPPAQIGRKSLLQQSPEKKAKNKRRDFALMDRGYRILRLTETEIKNNPLPKISR